MSIGIDFILKASTAQFTAAMAKVANSTAEIRKGLAKNFDGRDLARGLVTAFGLSVDKIADKFIRLFSDFSHEAQEAYGTLGDLTDKLTEKTLEAGRAKLSDEQRYQLALMESARLQKAIAENSGKTTQDQIKLTQDKISLIEKQKDAEESLAKIQKDKADAAEKAAKAEEEKQKWLEQVTENAHASVEQDDKEQAERDRNQQRFEDSLREKFAPSVEQLAGMSAGGFAAADDPRLIAKQILEKEKNAAILGGRGDIGGAIKLGREATMMREGLQNVAGSGAALTQQTAEAAFSASLRETNENLEGIEKSLKGIIKAQ